MEEIMESKFVVLTGSMHFLPQIQEEFIKIARRGDVPYGPVVNPLTPGYELIKPQLEQMYRKIIELYADELRVVNVYGYLGESTRREIEIAKFYGVPVTYLEDKC